MAELAIKRWTITEFADNYLWNLGNLWEDVPSIIAEWEEEWNDLDRLNLYAEWFGYNDKLTQVREWARQGLLSTEQRVRYDEIEALVGQHGPTIERLLNAQ